MWRLVLKSRFSPLQRVSFSGQKDDGRVGESVCIAMFTKIKQCRNNNLQKYIIVYNTLKYNNIHKCNLLQYKCKYNKTCNFLLIS